MNPISVLFYGPLHIRKPEARNEVSILSAEPPGSGEVPSMVRKLKARR